MALDAGAASALQPKGDELVTFTKEPDECARHDQGELAAAQERQARPAFALLATEFQPLARLLDGMEVRTRRAAKWISLHWQRSPLALKIVSVIAIALVVAGAAYAAVSIVF
jgi:hypothetical protein